jgi:S-formylglutathione hydrolase FrmB
MTRVLLYCLLLQLSWGSAPVQKTTNGPNHASSQNVLVKDSVFYSPALQRDMRYRVLLPRNYAKGGRFAVLYLLHGLYGDYLNWDTRTGLENYARNLKLLIVMPDAGDSWYTDSATVPGDKFEEYITKDLVSEIDGKYRTIREGHGRAIAGLSMGGYGAVKLALKYPGLFELAGSLSGAFNAAQNLDTLRPEFAAKLGEVFGNEGSRERTNNDVFLLLNTPHQTSHPYFYLGCGTADFFVETNRALVIELSARKIAYEYHETPGGHTWEYWDRELQPMLQVIDGTVGRTSPPSRPEVKTKQ